MTTGPVEGTKELGHQIDKLMAILTRAGQDNSPASTPKTPRQRGHGRGQMDRKTPGCPAPIMVQLVWDRLPQSTVHLLAMAQGPPQVEARDRTPKGLKKALSTGRIPAP